MTPRIYWLAWGAVAIATLWAGRVVWIAPVLRELRALRQAIERD
jgi:hypothetical protein